MQRVARDEALAVAAVAVDEPGEERLGGLVARVVGRMREFVEGEGEWEGGEGDVESFLPGVSKGLGRVENREKGGGGGRKLQSLRRAIRGPVRSGAEVGERRDAGRRWRRARCCFRAGGVGGGGCVGWTALRGAAWLAFCRRRVQSVQLLNDVMVPRSSWLR